LTIKLTQRVATRISLWPIPQTPYSSFIVAVMPISCDCQRTCRSAPGGAQQQKTRRRAPGESAAQPLWRTNARLVAFYPVFVVGNLR